MPGGLHEEDVDAEFTPTQPELTWYTRYLNVMLNQFGKRQRNFWDAHFWDAHR